MQLNENIRSQNYVWNYFLTPCSLLKLFSILSPNDMKVTNDLCVKIKGSVFNPLLTWPISIIWPYDYTLFLETVSAAGFR